jgi:sulfate transport system ATP-binding protein
MNHGRIEQVGTPEEIYHEPANAFVYEFLGDVNVFHARVEGEQARVYVRPHLLEIERRANGSGGTDGEIAARVERVHAAGPTVKVELRTDTGDPVQAELTQERYLSLGLARGTRVFVKPKQKRVFVNDFSI